MDSCVKARWSLVCAALLVHGCTMFEPPPPKAPPPPVQPRYEFTLLQPANVEAGVNRWMTKQARTYDLGLVPGDVGYYLDVQEAQLIQALRGTDTSFERQGDSILLRIPGVDAFETGSSRLKPGVRAILTSVSKVLAEFGHSLIIVNSHTDRTGDAAYNQRLSEQRAITIASLLIANGVPATRISAIGHGEARPLDDTGTPEAERRNRRIDIQVEVVIDHRA